MTGMLAGKAASKDKKLLLLKAKVITIAVLAIAILSLGYGVASYMMNDHANYYFSGTGSAPVQIEIVD
ncbi:MAG: hypothetical protein IJ870_04600 [Alphaproteobacteria bacterium]|nr:hypothetical protein [Alphaproteobacteria bacterium]